MRIAVSQQEIMQRCESETVFLQQQRKSPRNRAFFMQ